MRAVTVAVANSSVVARYRRLFVRVKVFAASPTAVRTGILGRWDLVEIVCMQQGDLLTIDDVGSTGSFANVLVRRDVGKLSQGNVGG